MGLRNTEGETKVTFSFFKNAITIGEVWVGALSCRRRICLKPVNGRRFRSYYFSFFSNVSL